MYLHKLPVIALVAVLWLGDPGQGLEDDRKDGPLFESSPDLLWLALSQEEAPREAPERGAGPLQPEAARGCLPEPRHWSSEPELFEGVQPVLSRYLRFTTDDGEIIYARMFLLEIRPDRARIPEEPPEMQEKRRAVPRRMATIAHEITVEDPEAFTPDYDVPGRYVKRSGRCVYEVNLGSVKCFVRVTDRERT